MQSPRILLIEDNLDHALVASRVLERAGFHMTTAISGQAGIDALSSTTEGMRFDLVLLDYGLPDMDGMQLLSVISGSNVPVVFVTGRSDAKLAVDALRAGAANYIVKDSHYVSMLPEVARITLEQSRGRFLSTVARITLVAHSDAAELKLTDMLVHLMPAECVPVRYAQGDYLVFCRDGVAFEKLQVLSREISPPVNVRIWKLDHVSSLKDDLL